MNDAEALKMLNASESELNAFSVAEWQDLVLYLVDSLQSYFGDRIWREPIEDAWFGDGGGFCINLACELNTPVAPMNWKGILCAAIIDGKLRVSLTVFFYSGDKRLIAKEGEEGGPDGFNGKDFAEYEIESRADHGWRWKLLGWFEDVYGEYDAYD